MPEPEGPGREAIDVLYSFVAALELTPTVAIHSTGRDGKVGFWNRCCADLFGVQAADAMGQPLPNLATHLDGEDVFADAVASVWRTGIPHARDWYVQTRDGRRLWLYSTHFPVRRNGSVHQVFCMEIDVTERKEAELAGGHGGSFHEMFALSHDAIVLLHGNVVVNANPAALRLFHCSDPGELIGRTLPDFAAPLGSSGEAGQAMTEPGTRYEMQYRLPDGTAFLGEVQLTPLMVDHLPLSYATIRDITARKEAERNLVMAAQVFENSRDAIIVLDRDYRVVAVNHAFSELMGYRACEIVGREVPVLRSGVHGPEFYQQIWDYVAEHDHWEGELWNRRRDGHEFPSWVALTAIRGDGGQMADYMAIMSDITDRKRSEEKTRHLAEHDFLTDLPNRVLLLDRLHQALAAARRKHTSVAVMFIDLDRFKAVNDTYGHQAGDQVLKEMAVRLSRCVRGVDTVSRQGGDEFVVILADIGGVDQAAHVAKSIMREIVKPVAIGAVQASLSVSIGISIYPSDAQSVDALIQQADLAMYHIKQDGRNAFRFFSPEMNAHVVERVQMENSLRQALDNGEFVIEYLPAVSIGSGEVVGVEALVRWRHPERGLLKPVDFLPVAESSGLIVPIGAWVLRQACLQARRWRDQGYPMAVSVNLSNVQFFHDNLMGCVNEALESSGLAAGFLELEITEDIIMSADENTFATVDALGKRGVGLAIDNFGTGCSNLSFLRRVPLSKLKIDRSFVGEIERDPQEAAIIPAIIAVARGLKLKVVAEGVETAGQLEFLQQHGCDDYQGFLASVASTDPDLTPRRQ